MKIKTLCDRCFKDVIKIRLLFKYGSAVYCKDCHDDIETELLADMITVYVKSQNDQREQELRSKIIPYEFVRKEA